jgi:hypothetical protein
MSWDQKTRSNATAAIPYAYEASEDDPLVLLPNPEVVALVEKAFEYLENGHSYRETAHWISTQSGKKISHQGLANIWRRHCPAKESDRQKALKKQRLKNKPKTAEEKHAAKLKRKRSDARRILTLAEKKIKASGIEEDNISEGLDFDARPEEREVIFTPNPGPQTEFLAASEREVLYGGAAGGGKSFGLLADPLRYFSVPDFNGLILRRTNDELRELVWKSQELYPKAYPGAKWAEKKSQWTFPSGAKLWMTYLERDEDVLRYQGQAFSYIGVDELTQYATPFSWQYLRSRLRTTNPDLPVFLRATSNPGGPGHQWVKNAFVDPAPAGKAFDATDIESGEVLRYPDSHAKAGQPLFQRRFIPATLKDNPYLYDEGTYEANLLSLPETQRRQLLQGDWAVADGAAFSEFRLGTHTCEPFDIPDDWMRFRACDYGYSSWSSVHWFAVDPSYETLYLYRELYVSKHTGRDLARAVLDAERGDRIQYGVLDSSCWHQRGQVGPSIAEGCRWRPSDRSAGARVAGKNRIHELLKVDDVTEVPGLVIFNTSRQIIADLPTIPSCPKGTDDIDKRFASDHTYDCLRYGAMSRPRAFSPFDMGQGIPTKRWAPADSVFGY